MKKSLTLLLASLAALALIAGCKGNSTQAAEKTQPAAKQATAKTTEQAPAKAAAEQAPAKKAAAGQSGKVVETMNGGGYTYLQVDTGKEKFWAAAPQLKVKVGDNVMIPKGMVMTNFKSPTLKRTFDKIYFVNSVLVGNGQQALNDSHKMPSGHPAVNAGEKTDLSFKGLKKAAGGETIAEIYKEKAKLSGKEIAVRGKVVKFNPNIMGKNWVHVQDGTGQDLTVTTNAKAKVGDTVLVKGVLTTDKDFGAGYKYDVIVENGKVTVE